MKKLLLFLLTIPALMFGQNIEYLPKRDINQNVIRNTGFFIASPDNNAPKPWKLMIAIHGVGERSSGTLENLKNLWLGFDYNGDGIREGGAFVTDDMKRAINQYGILLVVPTYESNEFFEPVKVNIVYEYAKANYSIHDKMLLTGFSYGGGAVFKYISSNTSNANRVAYAVPVAAVNSLGDATIPGRVGMPVHAYSNDNDNTVNISNTKAQITAINASNPVLKALFTGFRRDGHGANNEAWGLVPPKAPGGQGFTDGAENTYQVFTDIIVTGRPRQMKSGTIITEPDPPLPPTGLKAEFNLTTGQVINTPTFEMDATASTGVRTDWQGYAWDFKPVEGGSWSARPEGGMYGGPKKKLINLANGKYLVTLTVRDATGRVASKAATITVALQVTRIPLAFDSETDLIYYSDGTSEKGVAVFSGGQWVVKNSAGQVINL